MEKTAYKTCPACRGTGHKLNEPINPCAHCMGSGQVENKDAEELKKYHPEKSEEQEKP